MPAPGHPTPARPRPAARVPAAAAAALAALAAWPAAALAQRDLTDIPEPDPEAELADFVVADGFEVNLFAADPMVKKPIAISFDERGRLWVAGSAIYPQLKPGQAAADEIVVLEDTDGDGAADTSTPFAGGFLIPTGVLPGDGGVYAANSTDLVHLSDTDGDGRADTERVVLSGFGTEDTHHIIHTFTWGPAGEMFFNQSIYIHSHVETPHGVRRLNAGGIWRFKPAPVELEVFTRGQVNPWGHVFDDWGQSFTTDGAYMEGINFAFPGAQYATAVGATRVLKGLNSGEPKHAGLARVSGAHFPDDWQGDLIANDFRANRVNRFKITEDGAGFAATKMDDLLRSKRVTFRPVAVAAGPDGALYFADWYNPIIQHGEVDFRDPRRDQAHGRIWRVSAKGRAKLSPPDIAGASVPELVALLEKADQWSRSTARVRLTRQDPDEVAAAVAGWLAGLDPGRPDFERLRLQALWVLQGVGRFDAGLFDAVAASPEPRARAAALRLVTYGDVPDEGRFTFDLPAARADDPHPRVRLEAVRALGRAGTGAAAEAALAVLDHPVDRFLDYALWLTARELEGAWLPGLDPADLATTAHPGRWHFALRAVGTPAVASHVAALVGNPGLSGDQRREAIDLVGAVGGPKALGALASFAVRPSTSTADRARCLEALATAARERGALPDENGGGLAPLIASDDPAIQLAAVKLAGAWSMDGAVGRLTELAGAEDTPAELRNAAITALSGFGGETATGVLRDIFSGGASRPTAQLAALAALARGDSAGAAALAVEAVGEGTVPAGRAGAVFGVLLARKDGVDLLGEALGSRPLPAAAAEAGLRAISTSGLTAPGLEARFRAAGGLDPAPASLTAEELAELVAAVESDGDPARGERVYRRAGLLCIQCHAIGGAGGKVGPDLVSIGASAPVDYLVESMLEPSKKVKEGYHLTTVTTRDGSTFAGTGARRTDTHLVLVAATGEEVEIPLGSVESESVGQVSLMPPGLTAQLSRGEFVDLIRFLHDLGRVPEYSIGSDLVVRDWLVRSEPGEPGFPVTGMVGGGLPAASVWEALGKSGQLYLQFGVETTGPALAELQVDDRGGFDRILMGGATLSLEDPQLLEFPGAGHHEVILRVNFAGRERRPLRAVLVPRGGATVRLAPPASAAR